MKQILPKKAFTLIELLLVMALLGILIVLFIGNFNTTLKRGRDQQRKSDLSQLQKALELYYEDNRSYPTFNIFAGPNGKFCFSLACSANETIYMYKTPKDPSSSYVYKYVPDPSGTSYYLYSYIENSLDQGSGVSQTGFTTQAACDINSVASSCKYYIGSSNVTPLMPN